MVIRNGYRVESVNIQNISAEGCGSHSTGACKGVL